MKKLKNKRKRKEARGAIPNLPNINQDESITGVSNGFYVLDYAKKSENLQSKIIKLVNPAPKVKQLYRCEGCGKHKSAEKFSIFRVICRQCLKDNKEKGKLAQSNFIERTLNNFRKHLRGALQNV